MRIDRRDFGPLELIGRRELRRFVIAEGDELEDDD